MGPARIMAPPPAMRAEQTAIMIDVSLRTPYTSVSLRKYAQGAPRCVEPVRKRRRGHQIGRTKGGMNPRCPTVADAKERLRPPSNGGGDTRRVKQFGGRPYTSSHLSEDARRGRPQRLLIEQNFSRSLNEAKHAKSIGLEPREIGTPPQKNRAVDKNPLARPRPTPYIAPNRRRVSSSRRGLSSAGRAPAWHAGGQGFDPPRLHQIPLKSAT